MKQVCVLDKTVENFAWCFDCVPEENSLLHGFDGVNLNVKSFAERGHIPHEEEWLVIPEASVFSASHVLEYSFSASAVAQFARSLDQPEYYDLLVDLWGAWENIYDTSIGFIRPRLEDGAFIEDFDCFQPWHGLQEGNALQYTFYVPHEPEKLAEKMGNEQFNKKLDSTFVQARQTGFGGGKEINAFSGVKTLYNHGNQPSLHIPWLFNFSGEPRRTQFWTRTICIGFYGTDGIHGYGYGQDEDQGQLGAWFVMASIGLFDVKGLTGPTPSFQLCSPAFERITIKLDSDYYSGQEIVIDVKNNAPDHYYLRSVKNKRRVCEWDRYSLSHFAEGSALGDREGRLSGKEHFLRGAHLPGKCCVPSKCHAGRKKLGDQNHPN